MSQRFFTAESRSTFTTTFTAMASLLLFVFSNNVVNGFLSTSFVPQSRCYYVKNLRYSFLLTEKNDDVEDSNKNVLLSQLYQEIKEEGQVGSSSYIREIAQKLVQYSIAKPAYVSLTGVHKMLHSQSKGASSGAIGPFVGKVTQTFVDESNFINSISLGPITIQVLASRKVMNDTCINVYFHDTVIKLFGIELSRRKSNGQGVWTNLFVGEYEIEKGKRKLVRIIEAPSLFIIEQSLSPLKT